MSNRTKKNNTIPISLDELRAQNCKNFLSEFVKEFWDEVITDPLEWEPHMDVICNEIQTVVSKALRRETKEKDLIINVPPGTSKTTLGVIMAVSWAFAVKPSVRYAVGSYSDSAVKSFSTKIKTVMKSEKYKRYFPETQFKRGVDTKHEFMTSKNGEFYAFTVGGTLTSKHYDILTVDDPLNPAEASSDAGLKKTDDFFTQTLPSRKTNKKVTPIILIMQRLHEKDPTGMELKRLGTEKIRHVCLPAEIGENTTPDLRCIYEGGLLAPKRLDRTTLDEAKIRLGSHGYSKQFDQRSASVEGNIIKKTWFKTISKEDFKILKFRKSPNFWIDTAYTEDRSNDPSGIISAYLINNYLYIEYAEKTWKTFPNLCRWIVKTTKENGYTNESRIKIEPKASGLSAIQQLKEITSLNISETPTPKDSKETRLTAKSAKIEAGRVILVEGSWNEEFVEDVSGFPTRPNDEYVDVLTYAMDYYDSQLEENPKDWGDFL
jgi:predicted phage terminase large subunit-like protein